MVKTPTYHVFHMYRHHQGATLLDSMLTNTKETGVGEWKVPEVTESVSENQDGIITVTLNNLSVSDSQEIEVVLSDYQGSYKVIDANIVSGAMKACNTFEEPETVMERAFTDYKAEENKITVTLPPCSVTELRFQCC